MEGPEHAKHGTIDKHTISKIIYRTVLAGQLQYVSIALPLKWRGQGAMERRFVVAAGVPLDEKLLQQVRPLKRSSILLYKMQKQAHSSRRGITFTVCQLGYAIV